ncbi:unnamed protein product [Bursaphelenchus xylophilus]|uniref:(pine wood nematode) hypothetical protein n=1 Tax=Bursaphelenchus xylophilus TaxID=6326 RepID=A0A1I7SD82_BURXY|nr:unnamed protein product [Bursaphelenchus xylophilus]CAG9130534.1 unnamed protein product [Bursaphelenchus xylophilus]
MLLILVLLSSFLVEGCRHELEEDSLKLTAFEAELLGIVALLTILMTLTCPMFMAMKKNLSSIAEERKKRLECMFNLQKHSRIQPNLPLSHLRRFYESQEEIREIDPHIIYMP